MRGDAIRVYSEAERWPDTTPEQRADALQLARAGRLKGEIASALGLSQSRLHLWTSVKVVPEELKGFIILLRYALDESKVERRKLQGIMSGRKRSRELQEDRKQIALALQSNIRTENSRCPDGRPHHFVIESPRKGKPSLEGRCLLCSMVENFPSSQSNIYSFDDINPHFPYQPCRACRTQQQNYLM